MNSRASLLFAVALASAASGSGCSLIADSSIDLLKCQNDQCQEGYTCRFDQCVKDKSLSEGQTCTKSVQCKGDLQCPGTVQSICSKACSEIYQVNSSCGNDKVCNPVPDPLRPGKFSGGACVTTQCREDADCKANFPNTKCVKLAQNGGLCLTGCKVDARKVDSAAGTDNCVSLEGDVPAHCGLIGTDYVCVPAGAGKAGDKCTAFPLASGGDDACGTNVTTPGAPGLPLVCMSASGTLNPSDGELRCRLANCVQKEGQPSGCANGTFCVGELKAREIDLPVITNFCKSSTD